MRNDRSWQSRAYPMPGIIYTQWVTSASPFICTLPQGRRKSVLMFQTKQQAQRFPSWQARVIWLHYSLRKAPTMAMEGWLKHRGQLESLSLWTWLPVGPGWKLKAFFILKSKYARSVEYPHIHKSNFFVVSTVQLQWAPVTLLRGQCYLRE